MLVAIASSNKRKIEEIKNKTAGLHGIDIISAADISDIGDIEETGSTFEENALIKARETLRITKTASLADDSGIEVDALDGAPGVYSARFGNLHSDSERNELLLSKMKGIPPEKRTARFVCVMALVLPDGREFIRRGECEGVITAEPSGHMGFGYDPVFLVSGKNCTMAHLTIEEKNVLSHRGKALDQIVDLLSSLEV